MGGWVVENKDDEGLVLKNEMAARGGVKTIMGTYR
jgi:hypothetical protein